MTSGTLSAAFHAIGTVAVVVDRVASVETLRWEDIWAQLFGVASAGLSRSQRYRVHHTVRVLYAGCRSIGKIRTTRGGRRFEKRLWALQICTTAILNLIKTRRERAAYLSVMKHTARTDSFCAL